MYPPVFLIAGGVLALGAGYLTAFGMEGLKRVLSRWHVSPADVTGWTVIMVGFVAGWLIIYPTMMETCEPTVTCKLLP